MSVVFFAYFLISYQFLYFIVSLCQCFAFAVKYWKAKRNSGTKQVVSGKLFKDVVNVVKIKSESKGLMKY